MARKTSRVRRTFTPQFKKDAVALIRDGRSVTAVAHDLGIARSLLQHWQQQLGRHAGRCVSRHRTATTARGARAAPPTTIADVTEERDILKKPWRTSRTTRSEVSLRRCASPGISRAHLVPRARRLTEWFLRVDRAAYVQSHHTYGAPHIHHELTQHGLRCGRHHIARLMRHEGVVACTERHFHWTATGRAELPAAPNHLQGRFHAAGPNQRWVSDITFIRTGQGWLYPAIVLDLFSRRIVGWAMHPTPTHALVGEALTMALTARQPPWGLVFHADGGGQYRAVSVQQQLTAHQLIASTSRPGQCLDNAVAESFFHTLKTELVYQHRYRTEEEARLAIFEYIQY